MPTIIIRNAHVSIWSCFFCNCNFNFFFFSLRCVTLFSKRWALSQLASSPSCSVSNARPTRSGGGGSTHTAHSHSSGSCNIKNIVKMWSWHQFVAKQIQSTKLHQVGIQENVSPCLLLPRRHGEREQARASGTDASKASQGRNNSDPACRTRRRTALCRLHRPMGEQIPNFSSNPNDKSAGAHKSEKNNLPPRRQKSLRTTCVRCTSTRPHCPSSRTMPFVRRRCGRQEGNERRGASRGRRNRVSEWITFWYGPTCKNQGPKCPTDAKLPVKDHWPDGNGPEGDFCKGHRRKRGIFEHTWKLGANPRWWLKLGGEV